MDQIVIKKGRTKVVSVKLPDDVSLDVITSQIRTGRTKTSTLIATWDVSFETDGSDGEVILTLDDSVTSEIAYKKGYMDMKRIIDGEPTDVFDHPLEVVFKSPITE